METIVEEEAKSIIDSFLFADIYFSTKDGNKRTAVACARIHVRKIIDLLTDMLMNGVDIVDEINHQRQIFDYLTNYNIENSSK